MPGIGFVDLEQARILAAPVSLRQGGVTLQVEQALAEPDRTLIVISSQGLPVESSDHLSSRIEPLPEPVLRLPDGSILVVTRQDLYYGGGKLEFPALPEGVYKITFEIERLPLLPAGAAPEGWQAPLVLRPATGKLPADLFPQPCAPEGASAVANGVRAQVLQVAQSSEETALQIRFEWENPNWEWQDISFPTELQDDLGNVYRPIDPSSRVASAIVQEAAIEESPTVTEELAVPESVETFYFPALSLAAREAVIRLPSLEFSIPDTATFTFDPGTSPQLGQIWNLDEQMEVGGIPLHLVGARLDRDDQTFPDEQEPFYSLEFTFSTPIDLPQSLSVFFLGTDLADYHGGGGGTPEPGVYKIEMLFEQIPQSPLPVTIERARVRLDGPWEMRWQIPWTGEAVQPVREVSPEGIEETRGGVTLSVESATFTDQVSVVRLVATDLPAGSRLLNVLSFDPSQGFLSQESQLYLAGSQGERIELARNVTWQPEGEAENEPGRLIFDPLPPLAERVTLHVPAAELFLPGQANFEIEVPEGVTFHSEEYKVPAIGRNDGQQETTEIRWPSDPWEVDIQVEVAGYRLHFTKAQIQRDLDADVPYRLILTSQPVKRELNGKNLSALNLSAITRPDGQEETGEVINEMMHWFGLLYERILTENYDPANWNAKIFLDVTAVDGLALLPGSYRVEIDGVTAWVSGPWELGWSLSGQ